MREMPLAPDSMAMRRKSSQDRKKSSHPLTNQNSTNLKRLLALTLVIWRPNRPMTASNK